MSSVAFVYVAVILAANAIGCRQGPGGAGDAAPPPSLEPQVSSTSERGRDDLWQRAAEGDPVDLARLADREGAAGLLEGFEEGGIVAQSALAALPYASQGELAFQRLGEIIRQVDGAKAIPVLDAILGIAAHPASQVEPIDPPGLRSCADALLAFAKASGPAKARAKAISALRLFQERGAVGADVIPTDLDLR